MSGGEAVLLILLAPIALIYWGAWFRAVFETVLLVRPGTRIIALVLCWLSCFGMVLAILLTAADPEVRESPVYIILFLEVTAVALAAATAAAWLIGVSPLDDAIRRRNLAAVWMTIGLWTGTAAASAGANVGRGDTIGTTNGPLALGVATIVVLWAVLAAVAGTSSITQHRDSATGLRQGGLLIAWGLIMGRATAGDWESVAGTLRDYELQGAPALVLLFIAISLEIWLRPSRRRPVPPRGAGFAPAAGYLLLAAGWVLWLGKP
jgi:hypothetical protein